MNESTMLAKKEYKRNILFFSFLLFVFSVLNKLIKIVPLYVYVLFVH